MASKWPFLVVLFVFLLTAECLQQSRGKRQTKCDICIPLKQCSQLLKLVMSGNPENIRKVQEAICRFQGADSLVCCPDSGILVTDGTGGESHPELLPTGRGDCGRRSLIDKITGGEEAAIGQFPWIASLGYTDAGDAEFQWMCGGSIINERYILTAAHCINPEDIGYKELKVVRLGEWDRSTDRDCQDSSGVIICAPPAVDVAVESFHIHPDYNKRGPFSDDIGLIRLAQKVDFSNGVLTPICLPPSDINISSIAEERQEAFAAGWGITERGVVSNRLLYVSLPFSTDDVCRRIYRAYYQDKQLCVGGQQGKDSCVGDSGGPLVLSGPNVRDPYLQVGLVSLGRTPCGLEGTPAVYTSVRHYRKWIEDTIKP